MASPDAAEATERTALLNGKLSDSSDDPNGTGSTALENDAVQDAATDADPLVNGAPVARQKMLLLFPAVGFGVS
jgi:hypothetical protein